MAEISNLNLSSLVAQFLCLSEELRWRLSDTPNPLTEDQCGECRHDETVGCSWRCVRRNVAPLPHDEVRSFIRDQVGTAAFCYLDGKGEYASAIDIDLLIDALLAEIEPPTETVIRLPTEKAFRQAAEIAHPVFVRNGWTWSSGGRHVPTRDEIEKQFRKLAAAVTEKDVEFSTTGRLHAWRMVWRRDDIDVRLSIDLPTETE